MNNNFEKDSNNKTFSRTKELYLKNRDKEAQTGRLASISMENPKPVETTVKGVMNFCKTYIDDINENIKQGSFGEKGEIWTMTQLTIISLVLTGILPGFLSHMLENSVKTVGNVLTISGLITVLVSVNYLGRNNGPYTIPCEDHQLVTDGPYEYIRHPMYFGASLLCLGISVATLSGERLWWTVILALLLVHLTCQLNSQI